MPRLSVIFQSSLYCMAALSSLMLTIAEGRLFPTALGVPLAILAFFVSERWRRIQLSSVWADSLGVLAFLAAAAELIGGTIEARLLSGAHLLTYLQWIVLFRRKDIRHYWGLAALCVLQVAVGAVLTSQGMYGALLVCYFFWAIWTLSVFSLYQAQEQFERSGSSGRVQAPSESGEAVASPADGASARRHLAAGAARLALPRESSRALGTIQRDPHERWVSFRFLAGTVVTSCAAMGLAAIFFLLIPRMWIGRAALAMDGGPRSGVLVMTGFTDRIQLGSFGQILESTEPVLEMRLFDNQTGRGLNVAEYAQGLGYDEPLFRGAVLTAYDRGRWSRGSLKNLSGSFSAHGGLDDLRRRAKRSPTVRQEIRLQPIGTQILFGIAPVWNCELKDAAGVVSMHRVNRVLWHAREVDRNGTLAYTVISPRSLPPGTSLPGRGELQPSIPQHRQALEQYLAQTTRLPPGLERVQELAREVAGDEQSPEPREMARRLEHFLRDSGKFSYSLNSAIVNRSVDPVEDFLFHRRSGHCEYFASALALMLRGVGIPSRLVSGFKGGDVGQFTGAFVVEQRHAHAWVEAYIDGEWITLDPTPAAARSQSVQSLASGMGTWVGMKRFLSDLWSDYVVNMSFRQQHRDFYAPLQQRIAQARDALRGRHDRAGTLLGAVWEFLRNPSRWFSWVGGIVSFFLLLLLVGLAALVRRLAVLWLRLRRERIRQRRHRTRVAFYERFQTLCAALGLVRGASETPREFAAAVRDRRGDLLTAAGLADLPERLVELFYRIRFGEEDLDDATVADLEAGLKRLEHLVNSPAGAAVR